jgi:ankyrin repeat protein
MLMLKAGADVNLTLPCVSKGHSGDRNYPPFFYAVKNQPPAVIELLINHGADTNKRFTCWSVSYLAVAVMCNTAGTVSLLLRNSVNPCALADAEGSPFQLTVGMNDDDCETLRICNVLLEAGIHIDTPQTPQNPAFTGLFSAIYRRSPAVVTWFIQHGADIRLIGALQVVSKYSHPGSVVLFAKEGGDLFEENREGRNIFHPELFNTKITDALKPTMINLRSCMSTLVLCQWTSLRKKRGTRLPMELVREIGKFLV